MLNQRFSRLGLCAALLAVAPLLSCGPKQDPQRPRSRDAADDPRATDDRPSARPDDDVQIGGLMGTIDAAAVEKAFDAKMNAVRACRASNGGFSYVGGTVQFFFVIGTDGVPTRVVLEKSELGHHGLEACMLTIAQGLKFVKPKGGTAEVRFAMTLPADGDEAKAWDASKVRKAMRSKAKDLKACRVGGKPGSFSVTFYVLPQGKVQTAGVASTDAVPAGFAACVAKVILATTFPDPLGEVVRVTYDF